MSIKFRLIASYIAMIILPIILAYCLISFFESIIRNNESMETEFNVRFRIRNTKDDMEFIPEEFMETFFNDISHNFQRLNDLEYIKELNQQLKKVPLRLWIVVKKADALYFVPDELNNPEFLKHFTNETKLNSQIKYEKRLYTHKTFYFIFNDNNPGTLFLIADLTPTYQIAINYIIGYFVIIVLVIVITNGILTFFVSRSIIKPLNKLKTAAISIKNGDLDTKIDIKSKDELGNLAQTFEEMRQQLKKSIESQIQYDNNRKELISAISHDLKTPVTSIKGYVEGIMDGVAGSPEKLDKYLKTIHNNANRLDQLIDELFLFSKLDLRKLPFNFETIDIDKFLTDILDELRLSFTEPKLKMVYDNQLSSPVTIIADRDKLYRVIFNIINNASKYADPNKEKSEVIITISESLEQNSIAIEIRDNGRGIKAEELPYIFDRFYRAEKDRNSSTGGSGLGLAIAKLIIEEHGGQIWAESVYLEGTSIMFSLPKH